MLKDKINYLKERLVNSMKESSTEEQKFWNELNKFINDAKAGRPTSANLHFILLMKMKNSKLDRESDLYVKRKIGRSLSDLLAEYL